MAAGQVVTSYLAPATTAITAVGAASAAVTLTIPAAAAGLFNYLCFLELTAYATVANVGGVTPVTVTTTGITGTPAFTLPTAIAVGAIVPYLLTPAVPIKGSAAATAMTIVAPVFTNIIWRITAYYYVDV